METTPDEASGCCGVWPWIAVQRVAVCATGDRSLAQEDGRRHLADHLWRLQRSAGPRHCARGLSARLVADPGHGRKPVELRDGNAVNYLLPAAAAARELSGSIENLAPELEFQCGELRMCRNIKLLFNFEPPVTETEIRAASLQFVRKISGVQKPSKANQAAFAAAVDEVAAASARLLTSMETNGPVRNREEEAAKARARGAARFGA